MFYTAYKYKGENEKNLKRLLRIKYYAMGPCKKI